MQRVNCRAARFYCDNITVQILAPLVLAAIFSSIFLTVPFDLLGLHARVMMMTMVVVVVVVEVVVVVVTMIQMTRYAVS
jgi:hypothetical protein